MSLETIAASELVERRRLVQDNFWSIYVLDALFWHERCAYALENGDVEYSLKALGTILESAEQQLKRNLTDIKGQSLSPRLKSAQHEGKYQTVGDVMFPQVVKDAYDNLTTMKADIAKGNRDVMTESANVLRTEIIPVLKAYTNT